MIKIIKLLRGVFRSKGFRWVAIANRTKLRPTGEDQNREPRYTDPESIKSH
ncbi:MAG: hypothetical protein RIC07_03960 [Coleofasciculus sp. E1-EBD-02]